MHSGPPFASGRAHIGHMYNMVGKDAVNRFRLMQGYRVVMQPGFDCYGTVIEDLAIGTSGASLSINLTSKQSKPQSEAEKALEMRKKCREFVRDSMLSQMEDLQKWGILTDFRYSYFTSSKS